MQEIANIAENAMGVTPSVSTGPSTSLTSAANTSLAPVGGPGTFDVSTNTANTGIASIDTSSEVGGLEGEILDAENSVVTKEAVPAIDDTIEGTFTEPSTEVDISRRTANVPVTTDTVVEVAPETPVRTPVTTPVKTPVGVVVIDDDDEEEITVEVDEEDEVVDGEDVVVNLDTDTDDDDDDEDEDLLVEGNFECPDGFQKVKVNGQFVCQQTEDLPERVRPTGGAYYRPNTDPEYGSRRRA